MYRSVIHQIYNHIAEKFHFQLQAYFLIVLNEGDVNFPFMYQHNLEF